MIYRRAKVGQNLLDIKEIKGGDGKKKRERVRETTKIKVY